MSIKCISLGRVTLAAAALMTASSVSFGADLFYSVLDFESDTLGEKPEVQDAGYTPNSTSSINGAIVIGASSVPVANPLPGQSLYVYDLGKSSGQSTHFRYPFNGEVDVSNVRIDFAFQRGYEVMVPDVPDPTGEPGIHFAVGRANAGALNNSDYRPFRLSLFNDGTMSIDHLAGTTALGTFSTVNVNSISLLVNSHDTESVVYSLDDLGDGSIAPNSVEIFYNDATLGAFEFFVTPDPANASQIIFNQENNDLGQVAFFQDTNSAGGFAFDNVVVRTVNAVVEALNSPSGLVASSIEKLSATISWTDNSDNETAFIVERSSSASGPFENIATLDANEVSYEDDDVDEDSTYFYRVSAFNGFYSDPSAILEVKTLEQILPAIVDSTGSKAAIANSTVSLGVSAIGRGPLAYQWYAGVSGSVSSPVEGGTSSQVLVSVGESDVSYWVRVSNAEGSVDSDTFEIAVGVSKTTLVTREADLNDVFETTLPGDVIIIKDGTYSDYGININASGAEGAPVIVRAETPGGVILTGKSFIKFGGNYITASGFQFYNGDNYDEEIGSSVVQFRSNSGNKHAHHCRLTDCSIIDMNSWEQDTDDDDEDGDTTEMIFHNAKWIQIYGTNNRVDHCYFSEKKVRGALIIAEMVPQTGEDGVPYAEYNHRIDHNFFGPIPVGFSGNEFETIRMGTSDFSNFNGNMVIEDNYLYHCDGEIEVISNKSSGNTYRNNTLIGCRGSLVIRHGDFCTVEGNVIIGEGLPNTGGIRLNGEGHTVINNYVAGVRGTGLRASFVMRAAGSVDSSDTNGGYEQVRNALVAFNTFYDTTQTFNLGEPGGKDNNYPPTASTIANNVLYSTQGTLVTIGKAPTSMTYEGNMVFGSAVGIASDGFQVVDSQLEEAEYGIFRPASASPVIGASVGQYSDIGIDIDGEDRPSTGADVGADQVSALELPLAPVNPDLLGPSWMMDVDDFIEVVRMERVGVSSMEIVFKWNGAQDPSDFLLEATSNLIAPNWTAIPALVEGPSGNGFFTLFVEFDEEVGMFWRLQGI